MQQKSLDDIYLYKSTANTAYELVNYIYVYSFKSRRIHYYAIKITT